jgi:ActR/RegA family two-component response regulator
MTDGSSWSAIADAPGDAPSPVRTQAGPRALLIQVDPTGAETFTHALRSLHVESSWAQSGVDGLAAVRLARFDLLFVDLELPDVSGAALIRALRANDHRSRFIVVSGAVSASVTREALHLGALGVLGTPFDASDVIAAVHAALGPTAMIGDSGRGVNGASTLVDTRMPSAARGAPRSIAERWAVLMLNTIHADGDPKTIGRWAKSIGVSRSVLCECCRLIHVSPHNARDFARLMRVICRSGPKWQPETLLDLADARTLKKLLARAGFADRVALTPTAAEFLNAQQWIAMNNPGLVALRALLVGENGGGR